MSSSLRSVAHWMWAAVTTAGDRMAYEEARMMRSPSAVRQAQAELLSSADMILPNSLAELEQLRQDFPETAAVPSVVVHNCIDRDTFGDPEPVDRTWGSEHGLDAFLLCAGRVELRKNQLRLIEALGAAPIPVVLVGRRGSPRTYQARVCAAMRESDLLIGEVSQDELRRIYAAARVHALPSLYDTPGLASLEAGAMGCNLVMSEIGSQREYFGDLVDYCDVFSPSSIRLAVEQALARPWPNRGVQELVRSKFTWESAAEQTLSAYLQVLTRAHNRRPQARVEAGG